eukprot:scaffold61642_cov87-Phaeocystis_antarctica.AAC.4
MSVLKWGTETCNGETQRFRTGARSRFTCAASGRTRAKGRSRAERLKRLARGRVHAQLCEPGASNPYPRHNFREIVNYRDIAKHRAPASHVRV